MTYTRGPVFVTLSGHSVALNAKQQNHHTGGRDLLVAAAAFLSELSLNTFSSFDITDQTVKCIPQEALLREFHKLERLHHH